jgi:hypothetical protein
VFILSLAQAPGPVGDQVRTFIVGEDVAEPGKGQSEPHSGERHQRTWWLDPIAQQDCKTARPDGEVCHNCSFE